MSALTVNIGKDFSHRLANRDRRQGDGKHTAEDFRERYLEILDNEDVWLSDPTAIVVLDFCDVRKLGPSFANEAFAYFTKYAKPEQIKQAILFSNISKIQEWIIDVELAEGYKKR